MNWKTAGMQTRLRLIAGLILLVGLGGSVLIYLFAENAENSLRLEDSRMYLHDLELYGGKANVMAHEFMNWFTGLWQGTALAGTVACITIVTALGFIFVAKHTPPNEGCDMRDGNGRD